MNAAFPEGLKDEVAYDGTVKAFAYLLNNKCYVSIGKTQNFIKEATGENLNLSTGLICSLSGAGWFCDGLSIIQSIEAAGKNLYESVMVKFNTGLEV